MPKLTDTQLIILAAAAKRDDGAILPLPKKLKLDSHAGATAFRDLLKKRLIAEKAASSEAAAWRDGEDGQRIMLVATKAGRRASGAAAANERTVTPKAGKERRGSKRTAPTSPTYRWTRRSRGGVADAGPAVRPGTKQAQVIDLLRRPQGASIAELVTATGWQQHSVRGVIAGALKKKLGLAVTSKKAEDGERRYWIQK
jgi:Protein of unknown function (DUF3489)